jgi:hypothetical protein
MCYGVLVLCCAANRGRRYLRFIVPAWEEPYRLWLGGFATILIGALVTALGIGIALHHISSD